MLNTFSIYTFSSRYITNNTKINSVLPPLTTSYSYLTAFFETLRFKLNPNFRSFNCTILCTRFLLNFNETYIYIYTHLSPPTHELSHSEEKLINNCTPEGNSYYHRHSNQLCVRVHTQHHGACTYTSWKSERKRERERGENQRNIQCPPPSRIHHVTFTVTNP